MNAAVESANRVARLAQHPPDVRGGRADGLEDAFLAGHFQLPACQDLTCLALERFQSNNVLASDER